MALEVVAARSRSGVGEFSRRGAVAVAVGRRPSAN
jgi:hypothetical protein